MLRLCLLSAALLSFTWIGTTPEKGSVLRHFHAVQKCDSGPIVPHAKIGPDSPVCSIRRDLFCCKRLRTDAKIKYIQKRTQYRERQRSTRFPLHRRSVNRRRRAVHRLRWRKRYRLRKALQSQHKRQYAPFPRRI